MNSVALVTGGASGLGLATVNRFAKAGRKVVICDLESSNGAKVAANLGNNAIFVACDVTSETDVTRAMQITKDKFGRLDICVNCAGIFVPTLVIDVDSKTPGDFDAFKNVINVNLFGTYNVIRVASALMAKNTPDAGGQRGVIVNTASVAAFEGPIRMAAYSASKAAVAGMTLPLARELGVLGIRVMAIAPGAMDTPMLGVLSKEAEEALLKENSFPKRLGKPDEYAQLVESIVENCLLNGESIRLDSGVRLMTEVELKS